MRTKCDCKKNQLGHQQCYHCGEWLVKGNKGVAVKEQPSKSTNERPSGAPTGEDKASPTSVDMNSDQVWALVSFLKKENGEEGESTLGPSPKEILQDKKRGNQKRISQYEAELKKLDPKCDTDQLVISALKLSIETVKKELAEIDDLKPDSVFLSTIRNKETKLLKDQENIQSLIRGLKEALTELEKKGAAI